MSGKLMGEVFKRVMPRIDDVEDATARQILLALADHADDSGNKVWPSVDLLAWKTDYHRRTVQRALAGLRRVGVLQSVRGPAPGRPTAYRIVLTVLAAKGPLVRKDGVPPPFEGRSIVNTSGDIAGAVGDRPTSIHATAVPPEPSTEPSHEPSVRDDALQQPTDFAVARALRELEQLPGYPFDASRDSALLSGVRAQRPFIGLADEVRRWSQRRATVRDQRAALAGWLAKSVDVPGAQRERYCSIEGCFDRAYGAAGICMPHRKAGNP